MQILQGIFHELVLPVWVIYFLIWKYIRLGTSDLFQKTPAFMFPLRDYLSILDVNVIQIHKKLLIAEWLHSII